MVSDFQFSFEKLMKPNENKYLSHVLPLIFIMLILFSKRVVCQATYGLHYLVTDKDTSYTIQQPNLKTAFKTKEDATLYLNKLPATLVNMGFPTASVDSVRYDSTFATAKIYFGKKYTWARISTDSVDPYVLDQTGWHENQFENKEIDFVQLQSQQQKILEYYENSGYPFAAVSLKDIKIDDNRVSAQLNVNKGALYHIDSIHLFGKVKIKNLFLQHYLGIYDGSVYSFKKLKNISKLINDLPFLREQQSWDLSMYGTGTTLNLYLAPKPASQINALVGFSPASTLTGKSLLTADVHLDLNNSLGNGERILVNWQQLQPQSPRLNLGYTHPYIFNSNFALDFSFDLLKQDSSYLQIDGMFGVQIDISPTNTLRVFYQREQNNLLSGGIDSNLVILTKTLPANIDVGSQNLGLGYHFINTNYHLNPRKGNELDILGTAGLKKVTKNDEIINLKDPADPDFDFNSLYDSVKLNSYQFKIVASGAHYFPLGKSSTLKMALNGGLLGSPQTFKNELYRIGGYKILRGFDDESIYANQYAVFTAEYHYLVGLNSYFFGFSDVGFTKTRYSTTSYSNSFISGGVGLAFETKFGMLNLSYAVGKRNDVNFDIRSASKISFGYINYF